MRNENTEHRLVKVKVTYISCLESVAVCEEKLAYKRKFKIFQLTDADHRVSFNVHTIGTFIVIKIRIGWNGRSVRKKEWQIVNLSSFCDHFSGAERGKISRTKNDWDQGMTIDKNALTDKTWIMEASRPPKDNSKSVDGKGNTENLEGECKTDGQCILKVRNQFKLSRQTHIRMGLLVARVEFVCNVDGDARRLDGSFSSKKLQKNDYRQLELCHCREISSWILTSINRCRETCHHKEWIFSDSGIGNVLLLLSWWKRVRKFHSELFS